MTPDHERHCLLCDRLLDDPVDPIRSRDCGGDCLQCMADSGDPECVAQMHKVDPEHYRLDE